ncbi:GroES-like protein [Mytilinidion resinicola]|uniref:GroES-like protein n=1 Tax=Mytilinidion resinicola TaxID=574789 RepID=A0A6A6YLZ5_9PEZI|nr:GroES-like protein [Mytilinidion resinicola]KAF2809004.1 GroES-like protein [Mytilinidion resinicola]
MAIPQDTTTYHGVSGDVKPTTTALPALGPKEILIKITHTGLCASDLAYIPYGIALGHEGVGTVLAIGSEVTQFAVGDRAGGGYHRNSCGHCSYCLSGQDIWCYERTIFGEKDYGNGTIAGHYVGVETYLHKIPEGLESEHAAPLQCAGATVYNALLGVAKPGERVGIVGIGGLGHLAVQIARKMGAEVVVFSTSQDKEKEAKGFGANEFYLLDEVEKVTKPINTLVVSGNKYPDWDKFLVKNVLARAGTIIPLAAPHDRLNLPAFQLFFDGYNVKSSLVASRRTHDDMLAFCASHDVKPVIERFELSESGIGEAIGKLTANKMRYRGVLVAPE